MKTIITLLTILTFALGGYSQAPQAFSYQAVIRDASNTLITNTGVGMKISIVKDSANGTVVYEETHTPTTNTNGLISLQAGTGTVLSGTFNTIDWSTGNYFIKSETDPTGGTAYSISGASQLLSVPYALYAQSASSVSSSSGSNHCVDFGDGRSVIITNTNLYGFGWTSTSLNTWNSTSYNGTFIKAIATDSSVVVVTTTNLYGYGKTSTGATSWNSTSYNGTYLEHNIAKNGKIAVITTTNLYGFGKTFTGTSTWNSTSYNGTFLNTFSSGANVVVTTSTNLYGYGITSTGATTWSSTSYNGTFIEGISTK